MTTTTAKPTDPRQQPVINPPDQPPHWHWQLNGRAVALPDTATPGRRPAQELLPFARSRRRGQPLADNIGVQGPGLDLVNHIRQQIDEWQQAGRPGITSTTRQLLDYWTGATEEVRETPFYFAQTDAVLTHIWLHETQPLSVIQTLDQINRQHNDGIHRICHKMATGTGKTLVMAMLIVWQAANYAANPDDPRFTNRFLLVTPGITVRERLQADLIPDDNQQDCYRRFQLLPPGERWEADLIRSSIRIINWHRMTPQDLAENASGVGQRLIDGGSRPRTEAELNQGLETPRQAAIRVTGTRPGYGRVMVINDESHHCHRGRTSRPTDKTDTGWFTGLRHIRDAGLLHYVADLSATPTFIAQDDPKPVPWIVSDYSLIDAIEAGLVKIPRLPTDQNSPGDLRHRNIFDATAPAQRQSFRPEREDNNALLKAALHTLYQRYEQRDRQWQRDYDRIAAANHNGDARRKIPVMAVVMNNVANANAMFDYIAGNVANTPLLTNQGAGAPATIIVHSKMEDPSDNKATGALVKPIRELAQRFQAAYPNRFTPQDKAEDVIRLVMNTVGKPGLPGEGVRCVVSVNMLTEGWDATTVTHMLGFRKFGTALLCEQVAGRTLRRVGHDRHEGLLTEQYAEILGIPLPDLAAADPICPHCQNPKDQCTCVHPFWPDVTIRAENAEYRIRWPNIVRLDRSDRLKAVSVAPKDAVDEPLTVVQPADDQIVLEPSIGQESVAPTETHTTRDNFMYRTTAAALQYLADDLRRDSPDSDIKIHPLFGQALHAARTYQARGDIAGPLQRRKWPADPVAVDTAARWLLLNLLVDAPQPDTTLVMKAIPSRLSPWLHTGTLPEQVTANDPSRIYGPCQKAEINYAQCDSGWEVEIARQLDAMPEVRRWMRNHGLNWSIPYVDPQGQPHRYLPDFVAVISTDAGTDIHLVIEVKGQVRDLDPVKRQWTQNYWLPAVNQHPDFGGAQGLVWDYIYLDDDAKIQNAADLIRQHVNRPSGLPA